MHAGLPLTERLVADAQDFVAERSAVLVEEVHQRPTLEVFSTLTPTCVGDAAGIQLREVHRAADLWLLHEARSYGPWEFSSDDEEDFSRLVSAVLHGRAVLSVRKRGARRWVSRVTFDGLTWRLPVSVPSLLLGGRAVPIVPPPYRHPRRPM
jgi:hypothetical protein